MANRKQRRAAAQSGVPAEENPDQSPDQGELPGGGPAQPFPDHEEDALFKFEMVAKNFFLGNWKSGLAVIGVALLGVLWFGLWEGHQEEDQQEIQASIAKIDRKMPKENPLVSAGFKADEDNAGVVAQVQEGARRYEAIAKGAEGAGAVTAWMRAAASWERAGDTDSAAGAYAAAHAVGATGVVGWSAASAHAASLAAAGDVDGSAAVLRNVADNTPGILGEQALMNLAELYEDAGRSGESRTTYTEFTTKHPESALKDRAIGGLARVGAGK